MALTIYDTLVPQGDYPAVRAEHVQMPDGTKVSEWKGGSGASSWNDLTDRPFYEETVVEVLLEEREIGDFVNDMGYGVPGEEFNFGEGMDAFTLVLGETYIVSWDKIEYLVEAQNASTVQEGAIGLGNCASLGGSGKDEPFVVGWSPGGVVFLDVSGSGELKHTASIRRETVAVKKLDAKFLPMETIDQRIETVINEALEGDY